MSPAPFTDACPGRLFLADFAAWSARLITHPIETTTWLITISSKPSLLKQASRTKCSAKRTVKQNLILKKSLALKLRHLEPATSSKDALLASAATLSLLTFAARAKVKFKKKNLRNQAASPLVMKLKSLLRKPKRQTEALCFPSARPTAFVVGSKCLSAARKATLLKAKCCARSRADFWWTLACQCSFQPAKLMFAVPAILANSSAKQCVP